MCIFLFSEILKWIAMDIENVALTKEIDIEETNGLHYGTSAFTVQKLYGEYNAAHRRRICSDN